MKFKIEVKNLQKKYNNAIIFRDINLCIETPKCFGISGQNGAGKSTLIKILSGLLSPTKGDILYFKDDIIIDKSHFIFYSSFAAPYASLYEEFSLWETLEIFAKIKKIRLDIKLAQKYIDIFSLKRKSLEPLKNFSSGMIQRAKLIVAFSMQPKILFFDEPASNLDDAAKQIAREIIFDYAKENIVIIASNESEDLVLCSSLINLDESNNIIKASS
jgi:ABC-type multidrug transport system ATPase subunit